MIDNDEDQHNAGEKETGLSRHAVAKKARRELQKSRVSNETHCNENEPWYDHKGCSPNETEISHDSHLEKRTRYGKALAATLVRPSVFERIRRSYLAQDCAAQPEAQPLGAGTLRPRYPPGKNHPVRE